MAVDARTLERHVEAGHFLTTLLMLDIGGKKTRVIPREVQLDPVSDRPVHVDFMRLAEGTTVRLEIPVHFNGGDVSPGLKKGGVLNIVRHSIGLICPADKIPNTIEVDVSRLDINESIHINALTLPDGVKPIIRGRDFTVCSIVAPTSVIEEQRAAAAAAAAAASAPRPRSAARPKAPRLPAGAAPAAGASRACCRRQAGRCSGQEVMPAPREAAWRRRFLSPAWGILVRNMRGTGTMPASSSWTMLHAEYGFGPWKAKFEGLLVGRRAGRAQDLSSEAPDLHEPVRRLRGPGACASSSCRWRPWWWCMTRSIWPQAS